MVIVDAAADAVRAHSPLKVAPSSLMVSAYLPDSSKPFPVFEEALRRMALIVSAARGWANAAHQMQPATLSGLQTSHGWPGQMSHVACYVVLAV